MKKIKTLNMMTIVLAMGIVVYFAIISPETNNTAYGVSIVSLSLILLLVGLLIICQLKKDLNSFYQQFHSRLLVATLVLCCPMIFSSIVRFIVYSSTATKNYIYQNWNLRAIYQFLIILFGSFVPLWVQLVTLIFVHIQRKAEVANTTEPG